MQVKSKSDSPTKTTLSVDLNEEDMLKSKQAALKKIASLINVPGFRSGKAPISLVEQKIQPEQLMFEFVHLILPKITSQVLRQENILPADQPEVDILDFNPYESMKIKIEVEHIGRIKLADYKNITLTKPKLPVSATDTKEEFKRLQLKYATFKEVKRAGKLGDKITLDFGAYDSQGNLLDGPLVRNHECITGLTKLAVGFEEKIIGYPPGAKFNFELKYPKDYPAQPFAGKKVTFKGEILKVESISKPSLDDLAKKEGFDSLAKFKQFYKETDLQVKDIQTNNYLKDRLLDNIIQRSVCEIPQILIDREANQLRKEYQDQPHLKDSRLPDDLLKELEESLLKEATFRVKASYILREIAWVEKINVSKAEVKKYLSNEEGHLKNLPANKNVPTRLLIEKTLDRLLSYAQIKED